MSSEPLRFRCTAGGAVEAGRRRLRHLLTALGLVALGVGGAAAWADRVVPALLAGGAGALALFARRMSGDLDPVWLEVEADRLAVQMRRQRKVLELPGATARRLDPSEIEHLTGLATTAGITMGTGGFDSHRLGEIELYASDLDNAVLVDQGEISSVVTPDEPDRLLHALHAAGASPAEPDSAAPLREGQQ